MNSNLFPKFCSVVCDLSDNAITDPRSESSLLLDRHDVGGKTIEMVYAPFDHVNSAARLVIVGLTPGLQQASNALAAARSALRNNCSIEKAAAEAKLFASFSGPIRKNLVRLLDNIGVARHLGLGSTASLWEDRSDLVHFTSALRYPVFIDGANWSGQPDMLRVAAMRDWLETYTGHELATMSEALLVPLGPKVAAALHHLANIVLIDERRILSGLPHPSGANAERISCFLGDKPAHLVSPKTNATALYAAREALVARMSAL